jgi:hypothetical protein
VLVKAELAQIKSTIAIEIGNSNQSWLDMVRTAGMRRRVLISCFLGLFTQMSGNTLLSYYQSKLYALMGYTSNYAKTRINLANACWSLLVATIAATLVSRYRRRYMFMLSALTMLTVFICFTVSLQQSFERQLHGLKAGSAGISALFWYFAYAPCYNIGNNALTYSKFFTPPYPRCHRASLSLSLFLFLYLFKSTNQQQPTSSNSGPTLNAHVVSESNKSSARSEDSSTTTSTP